MSGGSAGSSAGGGSSTTGGKGELAGAGPNPSGGAFGGNAGEAGAAGAAAFAGEGGAGNEAGEGAVLGGSATGGVAGGAGGGGTGGIVNPGPRCADHPIPLKSMWTATASSSSLGSGTEADPLYNPPSHMIDGSNTERWSSGKTQAGDEWVQIDFGVVVNVKQVTLQVFGNDVSDFPRGYAVRLSNEAEDFNAVVRASGVGASGSTVITLDAMVSGRYLLIRQTGVNNTSTSWWTITELLVGCSD